ncbi:hypothetical protein M378DRAFT_24953 [Amanita muscaria Koide BX008]|uniref:Rieske domain-containing protein n=1 Tax=Amanita muscaria (strain Koide BX008) TaxID=946122 RepID=A0A0C2X4V2_AMAMK|nr:hypothetical protein M378DRAFT_24953 [Amanita muscaria Koide BX008]
MEWLEVAPLSSLLGHTRFLITLRSKEGQYHSLILFRLSSGFEDPTRNTDNDTQQNAEDDDEARKAAVVSQMYVMEASCPHLGADLSHAEIEECETGLVAVCPWHRYDFDLRTGKSEMGLKACTYAVRLVPSSGKDHHQSDKLGDTVYIETPEGSSGWRLVELRPVSEEFADPPPPPLPAPVVAPSELQVVKEPEPILPVSNPPKTLMQWAVLILNTPDPILKVQRTRHAVHLFRTGQLTSIGHKSVNAPKPPDVPARDASFSKNMTDPGKMKSGRKNRAVMLHALANIEQWAIDLAWDIMARFGPSNLDLPPAFFTDFTKMALDESKHLQVTLLTSRLAELSPSTPYGSMPVHASLWESAIATAHSLPARLAIIHLVHEARGLDVNPGTIERFRRAGDKESVEVMEIVHADEVTHVTTGHRWFTWCCARDGGLDPVKTFREEVSRAWRGQVKGPFNVEDREKAGLTREFYEDLRGEVKEDDEKPSDEKESVAKVTDRVARLDVQYDEGK